MTVNVISSLSLATLKAAVTPAIASPDRAKAVYYIHTLTARLSHSPRALVVLLLGCGWGSAGRPWPSARRPTRMCVDVYTYDVDALAYGTNNQENKPA